MHNVPMKNAVVLLSGGLDSSTVFALAKQEGFAIYALSFDYGQRNSPELLAAKNIADQLGAKEHRICSLDLRLFGGSALTDAIDVQSHADVTPGVIPNTYVPARNTIMLSIALGYAEVINAHDIFFGANIQDYSGYPDCRPAYIEAFEHMANLATKAATEAGQQIKIHAPLVNLSKADIIKKGQSLNVPYADTFSCYNPVNNLACGKCSACFYRQKGFMDAAIKDPTRYAHQSEEPISGNK